MEGLSISLNMIEYRPLVGKTINVQNLNLTIRLMNGTRQAPSSRSSSASSTEEFVDAPSSVPELSMELKLTHCNVGLELFEQSQLSSRLRVTVKEFQVLDHIESSTWTKFMSSAIPSSNKRPRETDRDMIKMELSVRENEHALRVAIFPIRLQIDQDTLDFIYEFFSRTGGEPGENDDGETGDAPDETFFSEFLHRFFC